ncbi:MAG TPA: ECF-type sigma factor [Ideonella sp.]|uniref:ECF-type sigma factor n=1 Tax=Ideonella sp. TaxID=1929293 RepID=UPI002E2F40CB|nr:ECF-type sigma factor [Ideonella sp.]HEX5686328.1 ECF-type sigma factor [Ideonella sp.]
MRAPGLAQTSPKHQAEADHSDIRSPITALLHSWSNGDEQALDRLVPLVYDDLRQLARRHLRHERDNHTLQSTGLVHEAFMRLAQRSELHLASRGEFFGWMSTLMRRILVDHARSRHAAKRGSGIPPQSLDALQEEAGELASPGDGDAILDIIQLDEALQELAQLDDRQGRVVELRFFGGLSVDETAEAIGVSAATVKREWSTARAWLLRELGRRKAARR